MGCSPWGRKEPDTTERLDHHHTFLTISSVGVGQEGADFLIQTVDGKAY